MSCQYVVQFSVGRRWWDQKNRKAIGGWGFRSSGMWRRITWLPTFRYNRLVSFQGSAIIVLSAERKSGEWFSLWAGQVPVVENRCRNMLIMLCKLLTFRGLQCPQVIPGIGTGGMWFRTGRHLYILETYELCWMLIILQEWSFVVFHVPRNFFEAVSKFIWEILFT